VADKPKLRERPAPHLFGRFLTGEPSLDELPHSWNVFRGDEARWDWWGPRPIAADELTRYGEALSCTQKCCRESRDSWQVSGRNSTTYDERVDWTSITCATGSRVAGSLDTGANGTTVIVDVGLIDNGAYEGANAVPADWIRRDIESDRERQSLRSVD